MSINVVHCWKCGARNLDRVEQARMPETGDLAGLLNFILIEAGTSLDDRVRICGRFAEVAEQRGYCVQDRLAASPSPSSPPMKD